MGANQSISVSTERVRISVEETFPDLSKLASLNLKRSVEETERNENSGGEKLQKAEKLVSSNDELSRVAQEEEEKPWKDTMKRSFQVMMKMFIRCFYSILWMIAKLSMHGYIWIWIVVILGTICSATDANDTVPEVINMSCTLWFYAADLTDQPLVIRKETSFSCGTFTKSTFPITKYCDDGSKATLWNQTSFELVTEMAINTICYLEHGNLNERGKMATLQSKACSANPRLTTYSPALTYVNNTSAYSNNNLALLSLLPVGLAIVGLVVYCNKDKVISSIGRKPEPATEVGVALTNLTDENKIPKPKASSVRVWKAGNSGIV